MKLWNSKKKKIILLGGFLVLVVVIVAIALYSRGNRYEWEHRVSSQSTEVILYAETCALNESDIILVVEERERTLPDLPNFPQPIFRYLPGHYLMGISVESYRRGPKLRSFYTDMRWEKYEVRIYDILTQELVRTIDVLDAFDRLGWEEMEEYRSMGSPNMYMKDGELYLVWDFLEFYQMEVSMPDRERNRYWVSLNYSSEEVALHEGFFYDVVRILPNEREREFHACLSIFENVSGYLYEERVDLFLNNGIESVNRSFIGLYNDFYITGWYFPGVASIRVLASLLPEESESLYSRFPGLRQFQGREDLQIQMLLTGYPTAEEILEMFMEDGREISFEGLVLSGNLSIDGEEHEIHSFEDYMRLRDRNRWEFD